MCYFSRTSLDSSPRPAGRPAEDNVFTAFDEAELVQTLDLSC
jgi:hypothetical protein